MDYEKRGVYGPFPCKPTLGFLLMLLYIHTQTTPNTSNISHTHFTQAMAPSNPYHWPPPPRPHPTMRPWGDSQMQQVAGQTLGESWVASMTISPYRRAPGYILPTKLGKQKKQSLKIALRIRVCCCFFSSLLSRWSLLTSFSQTSPSQFHIHWGSLGFSGHVTQTVTVALDGMLFLVDQYS